MRVLAVNSSPRKDKGNTALVLNPFLAGMKEAGADVELYYTSDLDIHACQGDLSCWIKTPGECIFKDDMSWLLPKISRADVVVLASPVYCDGMTGTLKTLVDRCVPSAQPFFEVRDGHIRHPRRDNRAMERSIVLVSNCGFWEMDNFDPLLLHVKAFCRNANAKFAGALLRPHGVVMGAMMDIGSPAVSDVLEAAKDAGRQMARGGKISPETLDAVSRELISRDMLIQFANKHFHEQLDQLP
jgi:multimeric flavodoxin WrbA